MNDLLRNYLSSSNDNTEPDPTFRAACQWVQENYAVWSLWLDRLPICTFDTHIRYTVVGCNSTERVITFVWTSPNPDDPSLPYNCDGGMTALPLPLITSRSCGWIASDSAKWRDWIHRQPECDASFYKYNVTECDSRAKRTVKYWWLLPDSKNISESLECSGGLTLPDDVTVDCEYMPTTSPTFFAMMAAAGVLIALLFGAIIFVFLERDKPIVKRSQYEMLILMIIGGILICVGAVLYAGKPTKLLCAGRPVTTSLGFTTIFGSLFVKSLRVYRVFMRSAMKRVTVTMTMMIKIFTVLFCIDVLILGAWLVIDFPEPTSSSTVAIEFHGEIDRVTCKSSSFLFTAVLMFWKAIVLLLGLYLSFLIRNVSADFQESIWIFASSLIVLVACLVVLPLAYVVEMAAPIFYVFLSCALLLSTLTVMSMMLGPKLFRLNEVARSSKYSADKTGNTHALVAMQGNNSSSTLLTQPKGSLTQRSRMNTALVMPNRATTVGEIDTDSTQL